MQEAKPQFIHTITTKCSIENDCYRPQLKCNGVGEGRRDHRLLIFKSNILQHEVLPFPDQQLAATYGAKCESMR